MQVRIEMPPGQAEAFAQGIKTEIAKAATAAVRDVGNKALRAGRASIGGGGFGSKWQNALRIKFFPEGGNSLDPAAMIYHKIRYAGIFETGGVIVGHPLLWIRLGGSHGRLGGRLVSLRGKKTPTLAFAGSARVRATPAAIGVPSVTIPKKFDVTGAVDIAINELEAAFNAHLGQ